MMTTTLLCFRSSHPVLLIDGGYLQCYRYFATQKYLKWKNTEDDVDIMKYHFSQHLEKQIQTWIKRFKIPTFNMFVCLDTPCHLTWRYAKYPAYKQTRSSNTNSSVEWKTIMKNVFLRNNLRFLEQENLEADDIIALSVKAIQNKNQEQHIIILGNDHDYKQLLTDSTIVLYDLQLRPIHKEQEDAHHELWMKIYTGDKSDNIPPVFPHCGKKAAIKMIDDPSFRDDVIQQKRCQTQIQNNYDLVAMEAIPIPLKKQFDKRYAFSPCP